MALAIFNTRCGKAYTGAVLWCHPFDSFYSFCLCFYNFVDACNNKHFVRTINQRCHTGGCAVFVPYSAVCCDGIGGKEKAVCKETLTGDVFLLGISHISCWCKIIESAVFQPVHNAALTKGNAAAVCHCFALFYHCFKQWQYIFFLFYIERAELTFFQIFHSFVYNFHINRHIFLLYSLNYDCKKIK